VGGVKEKQHTLKLQIYAYDLSASSSGRIIYIWTKYCVVLVKWGKFLSLRNYGRTAYRQWNSLLSSYCTLLFSGATSQCSRRPPAFQDTNICCFRHITGLSEGQSAYLNASIYNERKRAELKLCTEWHRNQHSFREVRESTPVTLIGHCGWFLGNFMLYVFKHFIVSIIFLLSQLTERCTRRTVCHKVPCVFWAPEY